MEENGTAPASEAVKPSETVETAEAAGTSETSQTAETTEAAQPAETAETAAAPAEAPAETPTEAATAAVEEVAEEISYHAVEKEGHVAAIWEMQGRKHLRTIDPRSSEGKQIMELYTAEVHE